MKPALSPRAQELLVERALRPLDQNELAELEQLEASDDTSYDDAAAAIALAVTPVVPLPAHLVDKIVAAAPKPDFTRTIAGITASPVQAPVPVAPPAPVIDLEQRRERAVPRRRSQLLPWLAAAACLLIAAGAIVYALRGGTPVPDVATTTPAAERDSLVASATDLAKIAWTPTADANAHGASGDVVWSTARQRGFMRFVGLTPNDPKQYQYQLWIFDKDRDDKFPVDGGVFDVSSTGEVIVPISAKLHVTDATLFAVTIEKPGGVVVSKRERIVVTAARS